MILDCHGSTFKLQPCLEDSAGFVTLFSLCLFFAIVIHVQSKVVGLASNPKPGASGPCIYVPQWLGGIASVVSVSFYRSWGRGFDSRRYQIFWEVVGLERGPLSLVSITKELLEWKSSGSGSRKPRLTAVGIRRTDHVTPSILRSWH
jgi:hypothetical protein